MQGGEKAIRQDNTTAIFTRYSPAMQKWRPG